MVITDQIIFAQRNKRLVPMRAVEKELCLKEFFFECTYGLAIFCFYQANKNTAPKNIPNIVQKHAYICRRQHWPFQKYCF